VRGMSWILGIVVAGLAIGCGDSGRNSNVDAGPDTDTGADGDSDTDADTDCDTDALYWVDENTGLVWQQEPDPKESTWQEAIDCCDAMELGGYDDWHLPTISELRSFIRGCGGTITSGSCGVTDECLEEACHTDGCEGCGYLTGPGVGGCFWDAEVDGDCLAMTTLWSSSSYSFSTPTPLAWCVRFYDGGVTACDKTEIPFYVRCVRGGP
jgi:hypothetical protein